MALVGHILLRLILVVLGYLVALLVGLVAVVILYGVLSSLPGAPAYFGWVSASPVMALVVPGVAILAAMIAVAVTAVPMLAAAVITELFALRQFWLHMIFGALVGVGGALVMMPVDGTGWPTGKADISVIAVSGAIAGLVYWLIAGRGAGFKRFKQTIPVRSPTETDDAPPPGPPA